MLNAEQRLNAREMCYLRMQQKDAPTKTKVDIVNKRRKEMVEENTQKFGAQTIGIHGQELPKYSESNESKQWWKYFPRGEPAVQSQLLLKQNTKYWAVNDEMLLSDVRVEPAPMDVFKMNRQPKNGEKEIPEKVTSVIHTNLNNLIRVADVQRGYQKSETWT